MEQNSQPYHNQLITKMCGFVFLKFWHQFGTIPHSWNVLSCRSGENQHTLFQNSQTHDLPLFTYY